MSRHESLGIRAWRRHPWRSGLAALMVAVLAAPAPLLAVGEGQGQRAEKRGAKAERREGKLDKHLRERLAADDAATSVERVIVTFAPGAQGRAQEKLQRRRGKLTGHLPMVGAVAAELPVAELEAMAADGEVLSMSVDAAVKGDGLAVTPDGTAQGLGYSLRRTLGLDAMSAPTTRAFVQNVNGYVGTVAAAVTSLWPTSGTLSGAKTTSLQFGATKSGMLLRFDNLFGTGAGQIPPGATITSASLRLQSSADGAASASVAAHRLLVNWSATATHSSMATSGGGIQFDNIEAKSTPDGVKSNLTTGTVTMSDAGLAATVQAWADGAPNYGWAIFNSDADAWTVGTPHHTKGSWRPTLSVTYSTVASQTWTTGAGVTVALIDSGMVEDGGSAGRIKTTRDFTTGQANPPAAAAGDGFGHGTHVAALAGGDKSEVKGVAPGVSYVSLKALNQFGGGFTSHVIAALQWAVANKATYGIDVINMSLGHPVFEAAASDPLVQAVEAAVRAGIVVVVSAGNIGTNPFTQQVGYGGITSPGNAPSAITVGSARTYDTTRRDDDTVNNYSSRGPSWFDGFAKPDLVAPGFQLVGAAQSSQYLYSMYPAFRAPSINGRPYLRLNGTSMAAGVVTGTVALMIEAGRAYYGVSHTPNALKAILQYSALKMTDANGVEYDALTQGAGGLNAMGAVQLAEALSPTAPVGSWALQWSVYPATVVDGQTLSWGQNIVWGENIVWGDSVYTNQPAWANNIVWGDNIVWGENIVWGDNIVWGENIVWGDNIVWGENIVWGDNIVWGSSVVSGNDIVWGNVFTCAECGEGQ